MTVGENVPARRRRRATPEDSADATELLKVGAPIARPTPTHPDNQDNPPHRPSAVTRPEPDLPLP